MTQTICEGKFGPFLAQKQAVPTGRVKPGGGPLRNEQTSKRDTKRRGGQPGAGGG